MQILFISPNRLQLLAPPLPLGLASVVADVRQEHDVAMLDLMFAAAVEEEVRRAVSAWQPEVIALSVRNIDNQDSRQPVSYVAEARALVDLIRELTEAPVVVGGSGFSILPRQFMEYLQPDFGLVGEGEVHFRTFLQALGSGAWEQVPGLVWRRDDTWVANPPRLVEPLSGLPAPALEYFDPRLYHEAQGSAKIPGLIPVQSRRGCPMGCIYCTSPLLEGRRCRAWEPEQVASWILTWHQRWGLTRFYLVDSMFNYPLEYARRLCRALLRIKAPLEWRAIINPAFADRELFRLMRQSGCVMVQVGNESGSELMLHNLGKGFSRQQVELTLRLLDEEDLPYTCFLLLGGPGETPQSVRESVDLLETYQPRMVNLTVGIRIYPGTPLYRRALAEGVVKPRDNLLWPRFYLAPAVAEWIWEYLTEVTARNPHWIF